MIAYRHWHPECCKYDHDPICTCWVDYVRSAMEIVVDIAFERAAQEEAAAVLQWLNEAP